MSAITRFDRTGVRWDLGQRSKRALFPRSARGERADNCWMMALRISNSLIPENDTPNSHHLISNTLFSFSNGSVSFSNKSIFCLRPVFSLFFIVFKEKRERNWGDMNPTVFLVYEKVAQQSAMWKTRNCWRLLEANLLRFKTNTGANPFIQQSNSYAACGGRQRPLALHRGALKKWNTLTATSALILFIDVFVSPVCAPLSGKNTTLGKGKPLSMNPCFTG